MTPLKKIKKIKTDPHVRAYCFYYYFIFWLKQLIKKIIKPK